LDIQPELIFV